MAKARTVYVCQECGFQTAKWMGKCTACGSWNSLVEEMEHPAAEGVFSKREKAEVKPLRDVQMDTAKRMHTGSAELDRVLGGGLVQGSLVLVGGDPGIGKSTLLLQTAKGLTGQGDVLYVSGEEAAGQIKMRAQRLGIMAEGVYLLCETDMDAIITAAQEAKPAVMVVDSIQTVFTTELSSVPGSVGQVRECCLRLMKYAKTTGTSIFVVGHVTKEGAIAGPRVLEHMVDCVLYFEGERQQSYRILRAVKNRFGSTNEIGVFEMKDCGLCEVPNPSLMMLSGRPEDTPGSAVVCSIEGTRPILAEVQALVTPTGFGTARRMASGVDYNRANMLLAVIEKRLGINMQNQDAYINIAGGLRIMETAVDLAVVLAVLSGVKNVALPYELAAIGEVGLTGEVRSISYADKRIAELDKMGFQMCILPNANVPGLPKTNMKIFGVSNLADVTRLLNRLVKQPKKAEGGGKLD